MEKLVRRSDTVATWRELDAENRETSVRKDLTRRLSGVCDEMASGEFEALVQQMTREQLRGERVIGRVFGHSLPGPNEAPLPQ